MPGLDLTKEECGTVVEALDAYGKQLTIEKAKSMSRTAKESYDKTINESNRLGHKVKQQIKD